ncbi:MAG: hypothetical protein RIS29_87 [Bacteroidota bacterium]|jgi:hypothetical protein
MNRIYKYLMAAAIIPLLFSCSNDELFPGTISTVNGYTTVSDIRPGQLKNALGALLLTVTKLSITDTINSRDFKTMRDDMPFLKYIDLSKATISAYNGFDGSAGELQYYYPANVIPEYAFYNPSKSTDNTRLKAIKFPQNIRSIGNYAFNRCTSLSGILELPASVTDTIGRLAFSYCSSLTALVLPPVSYIGESSFQGCGSLSGTLSIPDSTTTIDRWAFSYCSGLSGVEISSTINSIDNTSFIGCAGSFTVSDQNTTYSAVDGSLFSADKSVLIHFCNKSGVYNIPDGVTNIASYAFSDCDKLTGITCPASVSTLEEYAFNNCSNLEGSFPIGAGIFSVGAFSFQNCSKLTGFSIDAANSNYTFANGLLIDINQSSVKRCIETTSGACVIPSSIMFIENGAFTNCKALTSITLPENLLSIGNSALLNCTGLQDIYALPTHPVTLYIEKTGIVFDPENYKSCILHVPAGSSAEYKSATGWKNFSMIVEN